jgi:hypothetical protein
MNSIFFVLTNHTEYRLKLFFSAFSQKILALASIGMWCSIFRTAGCSPANKPTTAFDPVRSAKRVIFGNYWPPRCEQHTVSGRLLPPVAKRCVEALVGNAESHPQM